MQLIMQIYNFISSLFPLLFILIFVGTVVKLSDQFWTDFWWKTNKIRNSVSIGLNQRGLIFFCFLGAGVAFKVGATQKTACLLC